MGGGRSVSENASKWQEHLKMSLATLAVSTGCLNDSPRHVYSREFGAEKEPLTIIEQDPSKGGQ
jgi:hypothetical protein